MKLALTVRLDARHASHIGSIFWEASPIPFCADIVVKFLPLSPNRDKVLNIELNDTTTATKTFMKSYKR